MGQRNAPTNKSNMFNMGSQLTFVKQSIDSADSITDPVNIAILVHSLKFTFFISIFISFPPEPSLDSLPAQQKAEKTQFLRSEEHVAKGFMHMVSAPKPSFFKTVHFSRVSRSLHLKFHASYLSLYLMSGLYFLRLFSNGCF